MAVYSCHIHSAIYPVRLPKVVIQRSNGRAQPRAAATSSHESAWRVGCSARLDGAMECTNRTLATKGIARRPRRATRHRQRTTARQFVKPASRPAAAPPIDAAQRANPTPPLVIAPDPSMEAHAAASDVRACPPDDTREIVAGGPGQVFSSDVLCPYNVALQPRRARSSDLSNDDARAVGCKLRLASLLTGEFSHHLACCLHRHFEQGDDGTPS